MLIIQEWARTVVFIRNISKMVNISSYIISSYIISSYIAPRRWYPHIAAEQRVNIGAVSVTGGRYSVELFKEGGEGAGPEEIIRAFGWPESAMPR